MKNSMKVLRFLLVIGLTFLFGANAVAVTPRFLEADKLLAGDGASEDAFGYSIGLDGDTAVFGAWGDDDNGGDSGSAYVFTRAAGAWTEQQKLSPSDGQGNTRFGFVVAVDGDTAVIGAWGDDDNGPFSGSAYVFTRTSGVWTEQQKLTASDGEAGDLFGFLVAVDGDAVVIGALGDDDNGDSAGAVYVFTRDGGVWTERQKLTASDGASMDFFGNSIAVDGDTMLIAADGGGVLDGPGSVYVFTRSAGIWTEQQKLSPSDGGVNDEFGLSVSVDGSTAVIGSHWHNAVGEDSGAAYVFTRSAGVWTEQQKLIPSDATAIDEFGESVAVDGDTVVVSAWLDDENGDNSGSIYVFTRSVGVWTERLKLLASDGQAEDHLGYFRPGLQLSGSTVMAGAPQDTTPGEPGAAYVFDVSVVNAVPIGGNSSGGSVGLLNVLLLFLCRRRTV